MLRDSREMGADGRNTTVTTTDPETGKETTTAVKRGKKNYTNWVAVSTSAKFYDHFDYMGKRYRHNYELKEVLQTLKDYPVRSSKTFAEGEYTYREVLEIVLGLFFKPRTVKAAWKVADCPALNEKNARLSYTQATVYDVVADIGRIIDMTPNMEVEWDANNKRYLFTLEYLNSYGGEGTAVDIGYFDWRDVQTSESSRDRHAGSVISNVQNLVASEGMAYPSDEAGLYPGDTNNESGDRAKTIFRLPSAIKRLKEIRIWIRRDLLVAPAFTESPKPAQIVKWGSDNLASYRYVSATVTIEQRTFPINDTIYQYQPVVINYDGAFVDGTRAFYASEEGGAKNVFLADPDEYKYLYAVYPNGDQTVKTQKNTITYEQGSNELDLSALFDSVWFFVGKMEVIVNNGYRTAEKYATFGPDDSEQFYDPVWGGYDTLRPIISVVYDPYLSGVLRGERGVKSDTTVFFNQYGQIVDSKAFGNAIENYADEMSAGTRLVGKIAQPVGGKTFRDLYRELPTVGCTVKDGDRRYVLTQLSITRRQQSLDLLAELSERKKVRSRVVQADSSQTIYAIPDSDIQASHTHVHYVVRLSDKPIATRMDDKAITGLQNYLPSESTTATSNEQLALMMLDAALHVGTHAFSLRSATYARITMSRGQESETPFLMIPAFTATDRSLLYFLRFSDNRQIGSELYTDNKGKAESLTVELFQPKDSVAALDKYPHYNTQSESGDRFILPLKIPLKKDGYERTMITIQAELCGGGNVMVTPRFLNRANGLEGEPYVFVTFRDPIKNWRDIKSASGYGTKVETVSNGNGTIDMVFGRSSPNGTDTAGAWAIVRRVTDTVSRESKITELYMYANEKPVIEQNGNGLYYMRLYVARDIFVV